MTHLRLGGVGEDLASLFRGGADGHRTDAELLLRFVEGRGDAGSESAFAALVERHGAMVRGACRRVLGDVHAAEDAFQSTFLVMAKKAGRIGADVPLGGWLYRVAVRVALKARPTSREIAPLDGIDPSGPVAGPGPGERAELLAAIDAEIARLPARYREAVILCHIEGLDNPTAARRLRLPLGTLRSRLHRARHRLRRGLIRRGIVPAALGSVLASLEGSACGLVPAAGMIPVLLRGAAMKKVAWIVGISIGLAGLGGGVSLAHRRGDDAPAKPAAQAVKPSVAERIRAVMAEFHRVEAKSSAVNLLGADDKERDAIHRGYLDALVEASRKLLPLIDEDPADPAAMKAMLWHVDLYWISGTSGLLYDQLIRSVDVLLRQYADHPRMAWRMLVRPSTLPASLDDRLTPGLVAKAHNREAKGFALLALGEYLEEKANMVLLIQQRPARFHLTYREGPKSEKPLYDEAYEAELRASDAAALRAQAEAAFTRVVAEFGDVVIYGKDPVHGNDPVDENFNTWVKSRPIGDQAAERLAALRGVAIGKPVPDLSWTQDGKTSRLADLRGKVVVLSFRRKGDDLSRRDAAYLAGIAARLKDRPLVLVGLPHDGPVAAQFGLRRFPSTVVIDTAGTLRLQCGWSPLLGDYIEGLVMQAEAKAAQR